MSDDEGFVPTEGATRTVERTFTPEDVAAFADLSGDEGEHHLEPDAEGRLLVHGLLLATLPTQVGGERDVLARTMTYEFRRPVYTGERVTCEVRTADVEPRPDGYEVRSVATCHNEAGETVMTAEYAGVIRQ